MSHDLDKLRGERKKLIPSHYGTIPGQIEAVPAEAGADHFVRVHNKERETEEE
jgi:hypothetical protein